MYDTTVGKKFILNYHDLQPGDIILESGKKAHSKAIQFHTNSNYSHALICLVKDSLIHAENKGIFTSNPQRLLVEEYDDLKVMRSKKPLSNDEISKMEKFLRSNVGCLYSVSEAIIAGKKQRPKETENKMQFCSRLVAQAYAHVGYHIVDNPDYCQPAEIENSNLLEEIPSFIRKATKEDISFASTPNSVYENQVSTYKWLNKTRDFAVSKYDYKDIHCQNDVINFMTMHQNANKEVCKYIEDSGYLENYKTDFNNNPHLFDINTFIDKFKDIDNIIFAIDTEYMNIEKYKERYIENYKISNDNYNNFPYAYFKLEKNLNENLLSMILTKYITLLEATQYVLKELIKDKNLRGIDFSYNTYNNMQIIDSQIKGLTILGINKYQL